MTDVRNDAESPVDEQNNVPELMAGLSKLMERFDIMINSISTGPHSLYQASELMEGCSLIEAIHLQSALRDLNEKADELKSSIGKVYDWSRTGLVPSKMDDAGVELVKVEGVGRVSLTSDLSVSMPDKDKGYKWLIDNDAGDMITETVNASTLKAFIRRRLAAGVEVPEDTFKISMFTRSTITKN